MELIVKFVIDINDTKSAEKVLNNVDVALFKCRWHRIHDRLFWRENDYFGNEYYKGQELVSWSNILLIALFNGHFSICKFIIEIMKDVQKPSPWGETLIAVANCGYNGLNGYLDDLCRLLRDSFQIQK